jgi:hypothetical protein
LAFAHLWGGFGGMMVDERDAGEMIADGIGGLFLWLKQGLPIDAPHSEDEWSDAVTDLAHGINALIADLQPPDVR